MQWITQWGPSLGDLMPPSALVTVIALGAVQTSGVDISQFSQFGLLGLVLGWLMWRVERKLDEIKVAHEEARQAWNRVGKAIVLLALANQGEDGVKHQAENLLRDLGDLP